MSNDRSSSSPSSVDRPTRVAAVRDAADALCTAARQCEAQQTRAIAGDDTARRTRASAATGAPRERAGADSERMLAERSEAYARATAGLTSAAGEEWWASANALWLASREYLRRRNGSGARTARVSSEHASADFESLHLDYELDASALLALHQACDAYSRARSGAL